MISSALLVMGLVVAAAAFPANNLGDLVISNMVKKANATGFQLAKFEIISPNTQRWDEADVSSGTLTSVTKIVRGADAQVSMATGKLLLTIPFRLETVEASFSVDIIQYFTHWLKYTQNVKADSIGNGNLTIQVSSDGGKCIGTFYNIDFKLNDSMSAKAGTPVPNDVSSVKEIADFVSSELTHRYLLSIPAWSKAYIETVTRSALVDINLC